MTHLVGPDFDAPKATRSTTLHLVPSQFTERHQAEQIPDVWPDDRGGAAAWAVVAGVVLIAIGFAILITGYGRW